MFLKGDIANFCAFNNDLSKKRPRKKLTFLGPIRVYIMCVDKFLYTFDCIGHKGKYKNNRHHTLAMTGIVL